MPKLRSLLVVLPSMALGGFLTATLTTTAHAQDENRNDRHEARTAEWEYRDYHCTEAAVGGAYDELNKLGSDGWEAYAYASKQGVGFDWELKRRK